MKTLLKILTVLSAVVGVYFMAMAFIDATSRHADDSKNIARLKGLIPVSRKSRRQRAKDYNEDDIDLSGGIIADYRGDDCYCECDEDCESTEESGFSFSEKLKDTTDAIKETAEAVRDKATDIADSVMKEIRGDGKKSGKSSKSNRRNALKEFIEDGEKAAEDIADKAEDIAEEVAEEITERAEDIAESIKKAGAGDSLSEDNLDGSLD